MTRLSRRIRRFILALVAVGVAGTLTPPPAEALSNLMFDNGQIYTGIGWHTSFDGYSMKAAAYYDTYNPTNNRIILSGAGEDGAIIMPDIDGSGLQCRNFAPPSRAASWNGTYATVRLDAGSGVSITYNITRTNFCSGNSSSTINSRTSPNTARLRGQYQLPLGNPAVDAATGKYKVVVTISLSAAAIEGPYNNYNPNALFRLRAPNGLMGPIAGNHTAPNPVDRNAVGSRVYSNRDNHYTHIYDFGSTCDMTSATQRVIGLRDPDSYYGDGSRHETQGYGSSVGWSKLNISVRERFNQTDPYQWIAASRYNVLNSSGSVESYNGIPSVASTTRQAANGVTPDTVASFDMRPGGKYQLVVHNAYTENFLQAYLPTDAIYNAIDCEDVRGGDVYPSITSSDTIAIVGKDITVNPEIVNGNASYDAETDYTYRVWLDRTGDDTFNAGDNEIYQKTSASPITVDAGDSYNLSSQVMATVPVNNADYNEICFMLLASPVAPSKVSEGNANPAILCLPIGKKPHAQFSGADVLARGALNPTPSVISAPSIQVGSSRFGSWGEYGLLANGAIDSYSGGALMATTTPLAGDKSRLTFTNTSPPGPGSFDGLGTRPDITLGGPGWTNSTSPLGSSIGNLSTNLTNMHIYDRTGHLVIHNNGTITRSVIVRATETVRIRSNIAYRDGPYTTLDNLPQVIIKAKTIVIDESVNRVDAWLIADEVINTCDTQSWDDVPNPYTVHLTKSRCDDKLRINGPLQTGRIFLRRTAGASGTTTAGMRAPGEVLNLRPDAYLWGYGKASSGQVIRTETVKELPPRF